MLSIGGEGVFQATKHSPPLAGTKLYCFVTEAHMYEKLVQYELKLHPPDCMSTTMLSEDDAHITL